MTFVQTEEGRVFPFSGDTSNYYEYFLSDHLGNTTAVFSTPNGAAATATHYDDYLPFGMDIPYDLNLDEGVAENPENEYLYNRKELQENTGLYDYGARFYDPVVGRWTTVDPMAEISRRFSPYDYVENDPIRHTDPDGMETVDLGTVGGGNIYLTGEAAQNYFAQLQGGGGKNNNNKDEEKYGNTVKKRALNWRFWWDTLIDPPLKKGEIRSGMDNNILSLFVEGPAALLKEAKILKEAQEILKEKQLLINAFEVGAGVEMKIAGRTIIVEPNAPVSGMTLFGEKAFVLGKEAFQSSEELAKTILHELYRLENTAKGVTSGAKATKEAKAAANFADRAFKKLK